MMRYDNASLIRIEKVPVLKAKDTMENFVENIVVSYKTNY